MIKTLDKLFSSELSHMDIEDPTHNTRTQQEAILEELFRGLTIQHTAKEAGELIHRAMQCQNFGPGIPEDESLEEILDTSRAYEDEAEKLKEAAEDNEIKMLEQAEYIVDLKQELFDTEQAYMKRLNILEDAHYQIVNKKPSASMARLTSKTAMQEADNV